VFLAITAPQLFSKKQLMILKIYVCVTFDL
jgi:hypothetical protein